MHDARYMHTYVYIGDKLNFPACHHEQIEKHAIMSGTGWYGWVKWCRTAGTEISKSIINSIDVPIMGETDFFYTESARLK